MNNANVQTQCSYELRFRSLFNEGRGFSFPCNAAGHVDLDAMGEALRCNYYFVRTLIGRDFTLPAIQRCDLH